MSVRVATSEDREALFWLLLKDLDADNSLGFSPSALKVYEHVDRCCRGDGALAGVIEADGRIVGSIGLQWIQPWHSNDWFLVQVWQFVVPEYRRGTHYGEDLFSFAESHRRYMSERSGHDMVLETTVMSHKRLAAKMRLWRKHGKQVGAMFWSGGNV